MNKLSQILRIRVLKMFFFLLVVAFKRVWMEILFVIGKIESVFSSYSTLLFLSCFSRLVSI